MKAYILLASLLLLSCASSYKQIRPNSSNYQSSTNYSGVDFAYRLSVLRETGNKKYAKREDKKAIKLASVKLTNTTDKPLIVGEDIVIYSGNSKAVLLDPPTLHRELKQGVPIYLLYLLLTPLKLTTGEDTTPIGFAIGPGIAIGNMIGAGSANQNFLEELARFNIIGKTINPGETVYGIIGYGDTGYNPLSVKFTDGTN